MIQDSRPLTELEQETWDAYEWALDQVEGARGYDRVSVHKAFPDIQAAFDKCCAMHSYYKVLNGLTKDYDNDDEC